MGKDKCDLRFTIDDLRFGKEGLKGLKGREGREIDDLRLGKEGQKGLKGREGRGEREEWGERGDGGTGNKKRLLP